MGPSTVITKVATLVKTSGSVVEERVHSGQLLDTAGLEELRDARRSLCPEGNCGVLLLIPHGVHTDPATGDNDHFLEEHGRDAIKALAIVAEDEMVEATVKVYFAFHPAPFAVKVFADEGPARVWLTERLDPSEAVLPRADQEPSGPIT